MPFSTKSLINKYKCIESSIRTPHHRGNHTHTQFTPQHNTFNAIGARSCVRLRRNWREWEEFKWWTNRERTKPTSYVRDNIYDSIIINSFDLSCFYLSLGTSFLVKICVFFVTLELELEIRFVASTGCGSLSCDLIIHTCLRRFLRENVFSCELVMRAKISKAIIQLLEYQANGMAKYLVGHMILDHGRSRSWSWNMFISDRSRDSYFFRASGFHYKERRGDEANFRNCFP